MDNHFSGSQRLENRRRRRIAAESDGPSRRDGTRTTASADDQTSHGDGSDHRGTAAGKSNRWQRHGAIPLVPRSLWKYFACAVVIMVLGGGLLGGAVTLFRAVQGLPAGFERLFSPETGTLHRAFAGLLLFLAGQTALVIRWYRSRSLHDYGGRYRLWTKVAAAWFLVSACIVTDAHLAWSETCRQIMPLRFWQAETLSWLGPMALVGLIGWLPLYREMQGSRLSISFFLMSSALYLVAASLRLQCVSLATPEQNWVVLHGLTWLGHLFLLLSMTLHARHVIHFTIEPVESRSKRGLRKDGGRLDWMKPSRWFRRAAAGTPDAEISEEGSTKKGRTRRKPARTKATNRSDAKTDEAGDADSEVTDSEETPASNTARPERSVEQALPAKTVAPTPVIPRAEIPTAPVQPAKPTTPPQSAPARVENGAAAKASIPRPGTPAAPSPAAPSQQWKRNEQSEARQTPPQTFTPAASQNDEDEGGDETAAGEPGQPDMRGLSKKQRRKLMREMQEGRR